ncbi:MAG: CoA activase [Chloroflexi bacterium]|nr:CoA activase [Chloroflexota bacterium]
MITAGIDLGIETIKAVVLKDEQILAKQLTPSGGFGRARAADRLWEEVLRQAKLTSADVTRVIATGQGKWDVCFANDFIVETVADTRAARWLFPQARSVIDIGADQARAARFDASDRILEHVLNQKCAAGLGLFVESIARTLGVTLDEMSQLTLESKHEVTVNSQCGVYAELDVVDLIHSNVPKADIIQAINEAIATKVSSMVNEITMDQNIALIGGVARNTGMVNCLKKRIGLNFMIPEHPEFAGALGAALIAAG